MNTITINEWPLGQQEVQVEVMSVDDAPSSRVEVKGVNGTHPFVNGHGSRILKHDLYWYNRSYCDIGAFKIESVREHKSDGHLVAIVKDGETITAAFDPQIVDGVSSPEWFKAQPERPF